MKGGVAGQKFAVTATFAKLSAKEVKAFRLQTQVFDWVEFRNISLFPGEKTNVQVDQLSSGGSAPATHKAVDGDSLASLAERYLGSASRAMEIYEANRNVLARSDVLPIGAELKIPQTLQAPSSAPENKGKTNRQERTSAEIPLPTGRTVTGRVLTESGGTGVAGATVCLMRGWEANSIVTARTAADGTYTFHGVQSAEHYKTWIEAAPGRPAGVWSENDEFDVLQNDVRAYDHLFLKYPQSIAGTVRDAETGQPISGAMINFSMMDGKRRWIATDAQGRYRLYVLARNVTLRCDGSDRYSADSSSERQVAVEDNRETAVDFRQHERAAIRN